MTAKGKAGLPDELRCPVCGMALDFKAMLSGGYTDRLLVDGMAVMLLYYISHQLEHIRMEVTK